MPEALRKAILIKLVFIFYAMGRGNVLKFCKFNMFTVRCHHRIKHNILFIAGIFQLSDIHKCLLGALRTVTIFFMPVRSSRLKQFSKFRIFGAAVL